MRFVHSFLTTFANVSQRSLLAVPKPFRHPWRLIPERLEPPFQGFIQALLSATVFAQRFSFLTVWLVHYLLELPPSW